MKYPEFKLESYLAAREFTSSYNLCASDLESHSMAEILQMADEESLRLWNNLHLSYTEPKGLPELRDVISKQYGSHIGLDHVLCFAGAEEGIYSMAHAILEPTDHAIVVTPCYQSLEALPAAICSTTAVPLQYKDQWRLDVERVEKALQPNTKLIVINFPHNPTGALLTNDQQQTLIQLARQHDVWIFSDEVYRLLEIDPADRLPPIASVYEKGLSLSVMSKAHGLAGLRIGWITCQNRQILEKVGQVKHYLSISNSAPSEILSLIALRASEIIYARNSFLLKANLALLDQFFLDYAYWFEWIRPKGGCIGYPLFKSEESVDLLADKLLKESEVLILPSNIFDHPGNHFRISFGRRNMPEVLERFTHYIEANKGSWRKRS